MDHIERSLRDLMLAPYIVKAMALIGVRRRGGSNMFRHQLSTGIGTIWLFELEH